jgi:hypothetical protein
LPVSSTTAMRVAPPDLIEKSSAGATAEKTTKSGISTVVMTNAFVRTR